ncbi:MAG: hypothetical protein FJ170_01390 [Gammaproteobacteria bacterium]|nr:hypothetical protein [Gammaproteobacteria bacterium]
MNAEQFRATLRELVEENPFAIRAVLKILHTEFTDSVPTLAVSCEEQPRLLVNLRFIATYCDSDAEVKAVICHEFLHVLLRHTERFEVLSPAENLALDAVINAIIHRSLGPDYSAMMSRYYANVEGVARLLRRPTEADVRSLAPRVEAPSWFDCLVSLGGPESTGKPDRGPELLRAWQALYAGQLCADDIRDLARDHFGAAGVRLNVLLGNHGEQAGGYAAGEVLPDVLADALNQSLTAMNGAGIFRSPKGRGFGASAYAAAVPAAKLPVERWRREAFAVLRRHVMPDAHSRVHESTSGLYTLPVLSTGDRRAVLRTLWSPFLPEARWQHERPVRIGTTQVYLDVSGSMDAEMPHLVDLLGRLIRHIRRPFWAFSDVVAPARIERGLLLANTTGGTSLGCVLEHLAKTRPAAAVIITDGYVGEIEPQLVAGLGDIRLHAIVTRDGDPRALAKAGISYTQLSRIPA